jgi:hypothetical protein
MVSISQHFPETKTNLHVKNLKKRQNTLCQIQRLVINHFKITQLPITLLGFQLVFSRLPELGIPITAVKFVDQ